MKSAQYMNLLRAEIEQLVGRYADLPVERQSAVLAQVRLRQEGISTLKRQRPLGRFWPSKLSWADGWGPASAAH